MQTSKRIELSLIRQLDLSSENAPKKLRAALEYALLAGGGRVRPRLATEVAVALGDPHPDLTDAFAAALEMVHCASLVHDDLPAFDDAETRRGQPAVHRVYGEELAVLVGDGLIVMAFEVLGRAATRDPRRAANLISLLSRQVGASHGIVAGQAWESEDEIDVKRYHRAKTASLFEAATIGGAICAGADPGPWARVGRLIGEAYQIADDLADAVGSGEELGKPTGQDERNDRPSISRERGPRVALRMLDRTIEEAIGAVPQEAASGEMTALVRKLASRLCPPEIRDAVPDPVKLSVEQLNTRV